MIRSTRVSREELYTLPNNGRAERDEDDGFNFHVKMGPSTSCAGSVGLFAACHILPNTFACSLEGCMYTDQEWYQMPNKALHTNMRTVGRRVLLTIAASYGIHVADPLDKDLYNCELCYDSEGIFVVVATRDIPPFHQLFMKFGTAYWRTHQTDELQRQILCVYDSPEDSQEIGSSGSTSNWMHFSLG